MSEKKQPKVVIERGGVKIALWEHTGEHGPYLTAGDPEIRKERDGKWASFTPSNASECRSAEAAYRDAATAMDEFRLEQRQSKPDLQEAV